MMDKSKSELESLVQSQSKQLTRYETRLKGMYANRATRRSEIIEIVDFVIVSNELNVISDVVTAYKGLLKEKEALEASLATVTTDKTTKPNQNDGASSSKSDGSNNASDNASGTDQMRMQISTLMQSLATLSAEKSKMEASFQADKRSVRNELKAKEKSIAELQEKVNGSEAHTKLEVEKVKSKLIIERHEWEKESGNQYAMVRELQKLLADERQTKANLSMQLQDLKSHVSMSGMDNDRHSDLVAELEQTKRKLEKNEREANEAAVQMAMPPEDILKKLQSEMGHLKKQHMAAIQSEQHRAYLAEERNKALAAMHEERVASLESRLAELSATVGLYDRLRQTDQENIAKFKERIAQLTNDTADENELKRSAHSDEISMTSKHDDWNVNELINEIIVLHNVLLMKNSKLTEPIDMSRLYNAFQSAEKLIETACNCGKRNESLIDENEDLRATNEKFKQQIDTLNSHIKTLQAKVEVLNRNIDEQEAELRNKGQEYKAELKTERNRWKELINGNEIESRTKQSELEVQLQKQRERSLALLEEKENEIASLKASFNVFAVPKPLRKRSEHNRSDVDKSSNDSKDGRDDTVFVDTDDDVNTMAVGFSSKMSTMSNKEPMHMLHYAHELSRKEVEIVALRKSKHAAEQTLRLALQDKAANQEELYDKISTLEEQVDRLERCKTREGANLEYLKNVFLSFLLSNDNDGRKHIINAIGTILQFNSSELNAINKYYHIKDKK